MRTTRMIDFPRGLNSSSVWWCTGVCMDRHPAISLITSSQPLTLLLAAAVYDLPTGTVSMCLAVDSTRIWLSCFRLCRPDSLELAAWWT